MLPAGVVAIEIENSKCSSLFPLIGLIGLMELERALQESK